MGDGRFGSGVRLPELGSVDVEGDRIEGGIESLLLLLFVIAEDSTDQGEQQDQAQEVDPGDYSESDIAECQTSPAFTIEPVNTMTSVPILRTVLDTVPCRPFNRNNRFELAT